MDLDTFLREHAQLTRRFFLSAGTAAAGVVPSVLASWPWSASAAPLANDPALEKAIAGLEKFFTPTDDFRDVSRGKPVPHSLPEEKKKEVGLTRETWKLEVVSDTEQPAKIGKPLTKADGTALDFAGLLKLGEKHTVRIPKVMTCLNIGCPLGMGLWEGVPLREVLWLTQPKENLRRIFYYGYHNDEPSQMFRSSLPVGRVLEDYFDLPPVILCYKLNGEWLDAERGGPVRVVVPEAYGFKSIKWLTRIVLTNLHHANDTYANGNNDLDSPLKSFAATLSVPKMHTAGMPIPITGYAQVGISGVTKVQVWLEKEGEESKAEPPTFADAPWVDATILPRPKSWGSLTDESLLKNAHGFDAQGEPKTWPMRLAKIHWATLLPPVTPGNYTLRSRTVDEKNHPQPLPRPFKKSGHAALEVVKIVVK